MYAFNYGMYPYKDNMDQFFMTIFIINVNLTKWQNIYIRPVFVKF